MGKGDKFMELNEQEKTIVYLIEKLANATSDENTTQEAINNICIIYAHYLLIIVYDYISYIAITHLYIAKTHLL